MLLRERPGGPPGVGAAAAAGAGGPALQPPSAPAPPPPPRPLSPVEQARKERWKAFETADFDGRAALFEQTLAGPGLAGEGLGYEMLSELDGGADTPERRGAVGRLLDRFREAQPAEYEKDEPAYLSWRVAHAFADARPDEVPGLAVRMGDSAGRDFDTFLRGVSRLAWHGRLDALVPAVKAAWPRVRDSEDIMGWAVDEFGERAAALVALDWAERHPEARDVDAGLRAEVAAFVPDAGGRLDSYLAHLAGWSAPPAGPSDYAFLARPPEPSRRPARRDDEYGSDDEDDEDDEEEEDETPDDPDHRRLLYLCLNFVHHARLREGVPATKGLMFQKNLGRYLLERRAGDLEPRESMLEAMSRPAHKPKPKRKPPVPEHVLCPDRRSLDRFLADRLYFLNARVYDACVTLELMPAWLRYLESLGLVDAGRREKTLRGLAGLEADLLKLFRDWNDPALVRAMERWPEPAPA